MMQKSDKFMIRHIQSAEYNQNTDLIMYDSNYILGIIL